MSIHRLHEIVRSTPVLRPVSYSIFRVVRRLFWRLRPIASGEQAAPPEFLEFVIANIDEVSFSLTELGCSSGALLRALHKRFPRAMLAGVDLQRAAIEKGTASLLTDGIANIRLEQGDVLAVLPEISSDYLLSCATLIYLNEREIREFFKSLCATAIRKVLIQDIESTNGTTLKSHYFAHPYRVLFEELGLAKLYSIDVRPFDFAAWEGDGHRAVQIVLTRLEGRF